MKIGFMLHLLIPRDTKAVLEVISHSSCSRWVINLTILDNLWILQSIHMYERLNDKMWIFARMLQLFLHHHKSALRAVSCNCCSIRERGLLEHHLLLPNHGHWCHWKGPPTLPLLLICSIILNARMMIYKMQCAVDSLWRPSRTLVCVFT